MPNLIAAIIIKAYNGLPVILAIIAVTSLVHLSH